MVWICVTALQASAVHVHLRTASRGAHMQQQRDQHQQEEHGGAAGVLAQALLASSSGKEGAADSHHEQLYGSLHGRDLLFRPNGPLLMNRTLMNVNDLPTGSRHINQETVSADWGQEYPWKGDVPDLFMDNVGSKPMKSQRKISTSPQEWQPWLVVTFALCASAMILATLGCLAAK